MPAKKHDMRMRHVIDMDAFPYFALWLEIFQISYKARYVNTRSLTLFPLPLRRNFIRAIAQP